MMDSAGELASVLAGPVAALVDDGERRVVEPLGERAGAHHAAHIGGNQVMGFSSSATVEKEGRPMQLILHVTLLSVNSY